MVNTSQITFLLQSKPNIRQHHHHVHFWAEETSRPLKHNFLVLQWKGISTLEIIILKNWEEQQNDQSLDILPLSSKGLHIGYDLDLPTSRAEIFSRAQSASGRIFMFSAAKANERDKSPSRWGQLPEPEMRNEGLWESLAPSKLSILGETRQVTREPHAKGDAAHARVLSRFASLPNWRACLQPRLHTEIFPWPKKKGLIHPHVYGLFVTVINEIRDFTGLTRNDNNYRT